MFPARTDNKVSFICPPCPANVPNTTAVLNSGTAGTSVIKPDSINTRQLEIENGKTVSKTAYFVSSGLLSLIPINPLLIAIATSPASLTLSAKLLIKMLSFTRLLAYLLNLTLSTERR